MIALRRHLVALALFTSLAAPSHAQTHPVTPPPKPTGSASASGPSLAVTMQFIQDKLSRVGVINYIDHYHDNSSGEDWQWQHSSLADGFVADPAACSISYHFKEAQNGQVLTDGYKGPLILDADESYKLRTVSLVTVQGYDAFMKTRNSEAGHPSWDHKADPPLVVLEIHTPDSQRSSLDSSFIFFYDQDTADRVAKAMVHAVELCGGGNKDPF
ncbi:MAG: hypothetical protein WBY53_06985 [Acidobacteriaceae bacterium]